MVSFIINKFHDLKMYKYKYKKYKLIFPFKINGALNKEKEIIEVIKPGGQIVSEISVLQGYHKETLTEAKKQFENILKRSNMSQPLDFFPSVKFALSILKYNNSTLSKNINKLDTVALIDRPEQPIKNMNYIKLKIGRNEPYKENKYLLDFIDNNKNIKIRIDGNKRITSYQMEKILKDIPHENIDYIEDSFINNGEEIKFHNKYPKLKIAMDEEIVNYFKENNVNNIPKQISHVSIKLNLIGGIDELDKLTKQLDKKGITYNLSSTFEGPTGIIFLNNIWLDNKYKSMTKPGLDTLKYMEEKGEA